MGFYFRKSISSGPFKINFSKLGISYCLGVKGARVNFSNKGTYVNFGSHGIYYRKKISGFEQDGHNYRPINHVPTTYDPHTITSDKVEEITDIDSQDFIKELTEKGKKISFHTWLGIVPLILTSIIFFFSFFWTKDIKVHEVTETSNFVTSSAASNINVREFPDKKSKTLGSIIYGEIYKLLDENNPEWYKIKFNEHEGYISKKISLKIPVTSSHDEY